jgi:peptidoglycan-N-acetylglucosamine deacetylase
MKVVASQSPSYARGREASQPKAGQAKPGLRRCHGLCPWGATRKNLRVSLVAFFLLIAPAVKALDAFPEWKVAPWNGHKAAVSLTFDDGDPSHLDVAIPELNQRKMRGTFFLIANRTDRKDEWRKILAAGHEIASHSLDHPRPQGLSPKEEKAQIVGAKNVLQKEFGVPILTFAYPYGDTTPSYRAKVEATHLLARGTWNGEGLLTLASDLDWMNIPSRMTMTDSPFSTYQQWIDEDFAKEGWLVWMIHGLEGTPWGYQPISRKIFGQILDYLQSKDIWVGTFLEVGAYFRAQKLFEGGSKSVSGASKTWTWKVPAFFPGKVFLKLQLGDGAGKTELWQGDQKIERDGNGFYPILFNKGKLTFRFLPTK